MSKGAPETVETFLASVQHPRLAEVQHLRRAILESGAELTEQIKWNAPSFCVDGDDRVTFRLQPGDRVDLIFHRGAKRRTDTNTFEFDDPTGLLRWLTPDRGVIEFVDQQHTEGETGRVVQLVEAWIVATRDGATPLS